MIRHNYFEKISMIKKKKTCDHISVLSDQNGDLVGHMSFQERKIICSPEVDIQTCVSL